MFRTGLRLLVNQSPRAMICLLLLLTTLPPVHAQAPSRADSLEQLLQEAPDDSTYFDLLYHLSVYKYRQDPELTHTYGTELLALARDLDSDYFLSEAYQVLFLSTWSSGKYDQALEYALKQLEHALLSGHLHRTATSYNDLALLYDDIGEYAKSFENHHKSLALRRQLVREDDPESYKALGYSLNNMGGLQVMLNNYDSAVYYSVLALEARKKAGHEFGIAETSGNLGYLHDYLGNYDSALWYTRIAMRMSRELEDLAGLANTYINYGLIQMHLENYALADSYLDSALVLGKQAGIPKRVMEAYQTKRDLALVQDDYREAYVQMENYTHLKDSVLNIEKLNQISDLELKYQTAQNLAEIAQLRAAAERQRMIRNIIIVVTILILLLLLLIFQRYKFRQRFKLLQAEKLQELDRAKSNFFANISHEFRTPLTLILGSIDNLEKKREAEGEEVPRDLNVMKNNSRRLLQLINQLLELSRLEEGKTSLQVMKIPLAGFVQYHLLSFLSYAEKKQISFRLNGEPVNQQAGFFDLVVYGDPEKLEKVLYNLLSNAVKFTPEGGNIDIRVQADDSARFVDIRVTNSGPVIPEDRLPHIFDRFYQAHAEADAYQGTGIGLALVKELVELHHGTVQVTSEEGETTFTIRLPLGKDHFGSLRVDETPYSPGELQRQTTYEEPAETVVSLPAEADSPVILIVEDHGQLRDYIKQSLLGAYVIAEAANGTEGMEKAMEEVPDLIITDVMMPGMDGYAFVKKIRENTKTDHIPVIMLTARAEMEDKLKGLETGADAYLTKPFNTTELNTRVRMLLDSRQRLQEKFRDQIMLHPSHVVVESAGSKFLARVLDVIEEKMGAEQFGVEQLSENMAMSRAQLHRKLKALTGKSPSELIREYRLKRAAELIERDAGNMAEIAYTVGFSSQAYFTKSFQEFFQCTPTEYKRKVRQE